MFGISRSLPRHDYSASVPAIREFPIVRKAFFHFAFSSHQLYIKLNRLDRWISFFDGELLS